MTFSSGLPGRVRINFAFLIRGATANYNKGCCGGGFVLERDYFINLIVLRYKETGSLEWLRIVEPFQPSFSRLLFVEFLFFYFHVSVNQTHTINWHRNNIIYCQIKLRNNTLKAWTLIYSSSVWIIVKKHTQTLIIATLLSALIFTINLNLIFFCLNLWKPT